MNKIIETANAPAPFSDYAQAVSVHEYARWLTISGQVGVTPDGQLPGDPAEQHILAWKNVFALLKADHMEIEDIVEVLAIVTDHDQVPLYREARDRMLNGHKCASTLLVCGLANPDWKVEIAVKAAKRR